VNLIGRRTELDVVFEHLRTGKNLAISGAEGTGKTALAREAIAGHADTVYCADTSTLKTTCESLLVALGLSLAWTDNIQRKRALLHATRNKRCCFVFDNVSRVSPRLLSLLEAVHESHPMLLIGRSFAWIETGHLKMILWDFDQLELGNLREADARQLIESEVARLDLRPPNPRQFARELWRLSRGNPRRIVELCVQATTGQYVFGGRVSVALLELDRRIHKLIQ